MKAAKLKFRTKFTDYPSGNRFEDLPSDLKEFLENNDGTMMPIRDIMAPGRYEVTIEIKKAKKMSHQTQEDYQVANDVIRNIFAGLRDELHQFSRGDLVDALNAKLAALRARREANASNDTIVTFIQGRISGVVECAEELFKILKDK